MKFKSIFAAILFTVFFLQSGCESKPKVEEKPVDENLAGSIRVTPELAGNLLPSDTLYIILRKKSEPNGAPIAVKRVNTPRFPFNFEIGPKDQMIPGGKFEGPFLVKAKISKSGDAISAPGDLIGYANENGHKKGEKDITLVIDREIKAK
jgi:cytochrome c-type biogenesis protein CcmH